MTISDYRNPFLSCNSKGLLWARITYNGLSREQALPLAEQNVGTAERLYQAGEDNILALLLAQQNLNDQREANIKLQAEYASAAAALDRAVGGIDATHAEPAQPQSTPASTDKKS